MKSAIIIKVTDTDLERAGYSAATVTDDELLAVAEFMSRAYLENGFWQDLAEAGQHLNLKAMSTTEKIELDLKSKGLTKEQLYLKLKNPSLNRPDSVLDGQPEINWEVLFKEARDRGYRYCTPLGLWFIINDLTMAEEAYLTERD